MADGKVVVPPDSSGKAIDTSELTRSDGTVVERQRVVIGDPTNPAELVNVTAIGELSVTEAPLLEEIRDQLKRVARLLEMLAGEEVSVDDVSS
jgi:hypothetical protein